LSFQQLEKIFLKSSFPFRISAFAQKIVTDFSGNFQKTEKNQFM